MNRTKRSKWLPVIWMVIYLIVLFSIVTPLNFITINLIMIPVLALYMYLDVKRFALAYAVSLGIFYLLTGGLGLVILFISLFFLPPVILMGHFYKKKALARTAILAGTLTLMGELLLGLVIGRLFGFDPVAQFGATIRDYLGALPSNVTQQLNMDLVDSMIRYITQMIPFFIVAFSVFYVIVTHGLGRWFINRGGREDLVPALPPVRTWKLPKSLVWYFLIVMILDFTIPANPDSFLVMIVINLFPLLNLAFVVQAISFLLYFVHVKRKGKAWPALAIVLMIVVPTTQYIFSLLGLFDVMFPLREKLADKS